MPKTPQERRALLLRRLAPARGAEPAREPEGAAQGPGTAVAREPEGRNSGDGSQAPATCAQQGLWFLDQFDPEQAPYALPLAFRLRGQLVLPALRRALDGLVARQASLRTTFVDDDGEPRQQIAPARPVPLVVEDVSAIPEEARETELRRRLAEEDRRVFDLADGPLFLVSLLRTAPQEHVLLLNVHHIVFDGWSLGVLVQELGEAYGAAVRGEKYRPTPPAMAYTDYAWWEQDWLDGDKCRAQYGYWRRNLEGLTALELPTDRPRPSSASTAGDSVRFRLSTRQRDDLVRMSAEERVTPFMLLLAVFQIVLARTTGQRDIAVGSPMANRSLPETQELVGYFVNSVVLRTDLSGAADFSEVLRRVREVALGAYENQNYPFSRLVAQLEPDRDPARSPLFQVLFVMQEESWEQDEWHGLSVELMGSPATTSMFDVGLSVSMSVHGVSGDIRYRTDLFDRSRMERLAEDFAHVVERVTRDAGADLTELLA
ncbi:condensation domain-containing protein [Streptomyces sp. NPDC005900]|uniref:condensation domain-containing protein n=1 Tax=Streptomyces sp. NPDC005900 TaxID=3154569 RepID=UPI0033C27ADD